MKSILLALILFIAGLLHFFIPSLFLVAMPPYIPYPFEVIIITGVIELLLAAGISFSHTRKYASLLTALYFIAILPAHFHVSLNEIPMFGVSSPLLLWARTLFQSVFIYWAYHLSKEKRSE